MKKPFLLSLSLSLSLLISAPAYAKEQYACFNRDTSSAQAPKPTPLTLDGANVTFDGVTRFHNLSGKYNFESVCDSSLAWITTTNFLRSQCWMQKSKTFITHHAFFNLLERDSDFSSGTNIYDCILVN